LGRVVGIPNAGFEAEWELVVFEYLRVVREIDILKFVAY
jgi:hypothetical protein